MLNDKPVTTKGVVVGVDVAIHRDVHEQLNLELRYVIEVLQEDKDQIESLLQHLNICSECKLNSNPTGCIAFRTLLKGATTRSYYPFSKRFSRWVRKGMRVKYKPDFFDPVPRTHTW